MIREEDDRRWKTILVSPRTILELFLPWDEQPDSLVRPAFDPEEIPDGYEIDHVRYCDLSQAYQFIIYHPSFDLVPDGSYPPFAPGRFEVFFLPRFETAEEARAAATWMHKTERQRLRELLAGLELEGADGKTISPQ